MAQTYTKAATKKGCTRLLIVFLFLVQTISSLLVLITLWKFSYHEKQAGHKWPWSSIVLHTASHVSILFLIISIILYFLNRLSPIIRLSFDTIVMLLWTVGFIGFVVNKEQMKMLAMCDMDYMCLEHKIAVTASAVAMVTSMLSVTTDIFNVKNKHQEKFSDVDNIDGVKDSLHPKSNVTSYSQRIPIISRTLYESPFGSMRDVDVGGRKPEKDVKLREFLLNPRADEETR